MADGNFTQARRLIRINTEHGEKALIPVSLTCSEIMSTGFKLIMSVFSEEKHELTAKDLVGKMATVVLVQADDSFRYFNGFVEELQEEGSSRAGQRTLYRLSITSWLELLLPRRYDCRIFQEKDVSEVIKEIFKPYGANAKFNIELKGTHPKRRFWVQYNESDLAFFKRVCEREGLAFYFSHDNEVHTLHITDAGSTLPTLPEKVKFQPNSTAHDHLSQWQGAGRFATGKYVQRTYNYMLPKENLQAAVEANTEVADVPKVLEMESYTFGEGYHDLGEGEALLRASANQGVERSRVAMGAGACRQLKVGHHISIELASGAAFSDKGKKFTLTKTVLTANETMDDFHCEIEAVPHGELVYPFAPAPVINSLQTAIVTGPAGQEIHTDKLGRIKVQFHWDRQGKKDENTTCWLRVMQSFAGSSFGIHFTPRIGHEVVVAFENGNPDRPFVIGALYHPENMPPYSEQKGTRSGIRTRSTLGGGDTNFNELYFEDKKGSEEIYLQAEKDYNHLVKNDSSTVIQHDKRLQVDHDRTTHIKNDCATKIDNNKTLQVGNNETQKVGNNLTTTIGSTGLIDAGSELTLQVGGSVIKITASKIEISSTQVVINGSSVKLN